MNFNYLLSYCRDLAILATNKVYRAEDMKIVPALKESVRELDDPAGIPVPDLEIYLLLPDEDSLLKLLRARAQKLGLSETYAIDAHRLHMQLLKDSLTYYEIELYRQSYIADY